MYGLVAPLWEQARVLAGHITGHDVTTACHGSKLATKLKVMGITQPRDEGDEVIKFIFGAPPRR